MSSPANNRPKAMQTIKFVYKGKWHAGLYSECRDAMVKTNKPSLNMLPFREVEKWEPSI